MWKKYYIKCVLVLVGAFILFKTNPSYRQHEKIVATTCQSNGNKESTTMCPLGYGRNSTSSFDRKEFVVYNAGILSYSIYEEKVASFGILGNVFLTLNTDRA